MICKSAFLRLAQLPDRQVAKSPGSGCIDTPAFVWYLKLWLAAKVTRRMEAPD